MKKLSDAEVDQLSSAANQAAEDYIFSQVSRKEVLDLDVDIELFYENGLDIDLSVELVLDELSSADADELTRLAVEKALLAVDEFIDSLS